MLISNGTVNSQLEVSSSKHDNFLLFYVFYRVKFAHCHHSITRHQAADGGDVLQVLGDDDSDWGRKVCIPHLPELFALPCSMQLSLVSSYKSGSSHPSTEDMEQDVVVKHLTSVPTILRIRSCPWDTVPEEATLPSQADYFKEQSVTSLGQGYKLYTELTKAYLSYTSVLITGF